MEQLNLHLTPHKDPSPSVEQILHQDALVALPSLEAWETGEPRESALLSARIDPAEKDPQTAEWHQITIKVEGRELFAQAAQLAAVSPVLRKMISDLKTPKPPPKTEETAQQGKAPNKATTNNQGGKNAPKPAVKAPPSRIPVGGRRNQAPKEEKSAGPQHLEITNCTYSDFYDFLLTLQPQGLVPEARIINSHNVVALLALAKRFQISFLWDHCLVALREDVKQSNILRHYSNIRQHKVDEIEEIFFTLCLELLREIEVPQLEVDPWFQRLDKDGQIHLRVALVKTNRCLICGSQKFPWNIQITCPKCRDVRALQHKMCDTQSKEFVRLNQCRKCKVKMLDVQWVWNQEGEEKKT